MLLFNTSDREITGSFSHRNPIVQDKMEVVFPAKNYRIPPGETIEVDSPVGLLFLEHHATRGLVEFKLGEDMDALRREGRRRWYNEICRKLGQFDQMNENRVLEGTAPIRPTNTWYADYKRIQRTLAAELDEDIANTAAIAATPPSVPDIGGVSGKELRRRRQAQAQDTAVGDMEAAVADVQREAGV